MQNSRQMPQFNMRMPPNLKDWLQQKASDNFRSLNSEIVARLNESRKQEEARHAQP